MEEWWPVVELCEEDHGYFVADVDEAIVDRYRKAFAEFDAAAKALNEAIKQSEQSVRPD